MFQKWVICGIGPGHGPLKKSQFLDVHADFVFSVAGQGLGVIFSCVMVAMFGFKVLRTFSHASQKHDVFDRFCKPGSVF